MIHTHTQCRVCGPQGPLQHLFSLGELYISDFLSPGESPAHPAIPLTLMRCPACTLVQLEHTTPREWLYTQYWYQSGINEAMRQELADVVASARARVRVGPGDAVLDIGANDGTLLAQYPDPRPTRIAFEPATNLYSQLRPHAEVCHAEFFPPAKGRALEDYAGLCKIVTTCAMFYDLDDPNAFVAAIKRVLHPQGVWVLQLGSLPAMLRTTGFDTICHEHLTYYSLFSLITLLSRHSLIVRDVVERDVNGGSLRLYIMHRENVSTFWPASELYRVDGMLKAEQAMHLRTLEPYEAFQWRMQEVIKHLKALVRLVQDQGGVVDLYGASTKGNTLLQACGLTSRDIRWALERSPAKWGRQTVGSQIPIIEEAHGRENPAQAWLCPLWQFRPNVLAREADYLRQGGKIVFPLPYVDVVQTGR